MPYLKIKCSALTKLKCIYVVNFNNINSTSGLLLSFQWLKSCIQDVLLVEPMQRKKEKCKKNLLKKLLEFWNPWKARRRKKRRKKEEEKNLFKHFVKP